MNWTAGSLSRSRACKAALHSLPCSILHAGSCMHIDYDTESGKQLEHHGYHNNELQIRRTDSPSWAHRVTLRIQWYVPANRKRATASGEENVGKFNNYNNAAQLIIIPTDTGGP